jgi:hypothetical protein
LETDLAFTPRVLGSGYNLPSLFFLHFLHFLLFLLVLLFGSLVLPAKCDDCVLLAPVRQRKEATRGAKANIPRCSSRSVKPSVQSELHHDGNKTAQIPSHHISSSASWPKPDPSPRHRPSQPSQSLNTLPLHLLLGRLYPLRNLRLLFSPFWKSRPQQRRRARSGCRANGSRVLLRELVQTRLVCARHGPYVQSLSRSQELRR